MTRLTANRDTPQADANGCPWSATRAALQRAGPPDDDHAGQRAACRGADAVHRHAANDPDVATILTTAHDIHRVTVAFSSGRISTAHATAAAARANLASLLRQAALVTAAHADPSAPCRSRARPAAGPRGSPSTVRSPPPISTPRKSTAPTRRTGG